MSGKNLPSSSVEELGGEIKPSPEQPSLLQMQTLAIALTLVLKCMFAGPCDLGVEAQNLEGKEGPELIEEPSSSARTDIGGHCHGNPSISDGPHFGISVPFDIFYGV